MPGERLVYAGRENRNFYPRIERKGKTMMLKTRFPKYRNDYKRSSTRRAQSRSRRAQRRAKGARCTERG